MPYPGGVGPGNQPDSALARRLLHGLAQVIDVFLSHAEFQVHPNNVVLGLAIYLERSDDLNRMLPSLPR